MTLRIPSYRLFIVAVLATIMAGCSHAPDYGTEQKLAFPGTYRQTWAIAPTLNLSGRRDVDPLLHSDLVYEEVEQVEGLTAIPVNRVVEVFAALEITQIESPEEATLVCELLGVDGLVVPTVTLYDPYDPPKFGVALQLFLAGEHQRTQITFDARDLTRTAMGENVDEAAGPPPTFLQASAIFDAREGSTRKALWQYAAGRSDPESATMLKAYLLEMDRFCGFGYHQLVADLLATPSAMASR